MVKAAGGDGGGVGIDRQRQLKSYRSKRKTIASPRMPVSNTPAILRVAQPHDLG